MATKHTARDTGWIIHEAQERGLTAHERQRRGRVYSNMDKEQQAVPAVEPAPELAPKPVVSTRLPLVEDSEPPRMRSIKDEEYNPHNLAHFLRRSQPVRLAVASIHREYAASGEARQERMKTALSEQLLQAGALAEDADRFVTNVVKAALQDAGVRSRGSRGR